MDTKVVDVKVPEGCNAILGQSHFIKTVEDLYEALVNGVPNIRFGLAFCESSGPCLVRFDGNDPELEELASKTSLQLSAGHSFIIFMRNAYPINVLDKIKSVPEVCNIFLATRRSVPSCSGGDGARARDSRRCRWFCFKRN